MINPRRTCKFMPAPWYKAGGGVLMDGTFLTVFEMLQYFKTILTSVESL